MSRKIILLTLALATLLLISACGKNKHDHVRGRVVTEREIAPTCTDDGSYDRVDYCQKCNYEFDRKTITIEAPGHNYVNYVCTVCKKEAVPSVGLEFKSNGDGTCQLKGIGVCTDTEIIVPKASPEGDVVTAIGNAAFRYNGTITSLLMPDTVTEIKNSAFESCHILAKINISKSTESIGEKAFSCCRELKSIAIPDSVQTIGDDAFYDCESLVTATVGNGVTSMGHRVFQYCISMRSITIGNGLTSMGEYVLSGCHKLESIMVGEGNTAYKSVDGNLYTKDGSALIKYAVAKSNSSFDIPEEVKEIAPEAFANCATLMHLNIHDGVTSIGAHAFWECTYLTHVVMGASVSEIGDGAFYNCRSLYKITNKSDRHLYFGSDGNGYFACYALVMADKDGNLTYNNQGAQYTETEDGFLFKDQNGKYTLIAYLKSDESAVLPLDFNGKEYSTEDLRGIHNLIIPDGVTKIPTDAFLNCDVIYSVAIPATVSEIEPSAFRNCYNLLSIQVAEDNEAYKSVDGNLYTLDGKTLLQYAIGNNDEFFAIPDGVENILPYAFSSSKFTSVSIPDSVVSIGEYAFFCSNVTDLTLPVGVKDIGKYAFSYIRNLKTAVIKGDGVSIGDSAFIGCDDLESVVIENRIANMEPYVFRNCTSLTYAVIGKGTTKIGRDAFLDCSSLTTVVIPASVHEVEMGAFDNCTELTVYFEGTAEQWNAVETGEYNYWLNNSPVRYYSEAKPTAEGSYWHYDESGKAVAWE